VIQRLTNKCWQGAVIAHPNSGRKPWER
jgi:hypothetical protein